MPIGRRGIHARDRSSLGQARPCRRRYGIFRLVPTRFPPEPLAPWPPFAIVEASGPRVVAGVPDEHMTSASDVAGAKASARMMRIAISRNRIGSSADSLAAARAALLAGESRRYSVMMKTGAWFAGVGVVAVLTCAACGSDSSSQAHAGDIDGADGTDDMRAPDGSVQAEGSAGSDQDAVATSEGAASGFDGQASRADAGASPDANDLGGTPTVGGLFEQPEPWSKDVSGLVKSSRSDAIVAALAASGGWGGGRLQIDFSIPLFFGDGSTPRQTITKPTKGAYCYGGTDCDTVPLQMPMPANGNTEGSADYTCDTSYKTNGQGDCHVLVVEQTQKKLYEIYNATQSGTAFTALGAFVWDLTKTYPDTLRGDQCTSADAGGFPIAALLPTADEVAAGAVKHALRFILPNGSMKVMAYVHPATHAGSPSSTDDNAPPYGVRFRLKSTFDETPFDAGEKTILHAMKTYGMLLSDGGQIALTFADDRTTTAKWATQGVTALSFKAITVGNFEVVDLGAEIALTDNCVRNP